MYQPFSTERAEHLDFPRRRADATEHGVGEDLLIGERQRSEPRMLGGELQGKERFPYRASFSGTRERGVACGLTGGRPRQRRQP
jgi:hypothetical protein